MSTPGGHLKSHAELPKAILERNWKTRFIWLLPVAAAGLAAWFFYSHVVEGGPTLHIFFDNATGLQKGSSQVQYRGVQIGEVKDIRLTPDHRQVEIIASIYGSAGSIAREGSRFWIVRAEVGAQEIRGLRTIVSGNFITVDPGGGGRQTTFLGLSEAPVVEPKDALRIQLLAERAGSLEERSPVFYRGIQVGQVTATSLGKASQVVNITLDIKRHYAPLVRVNSKFWNAGGIHVNLSLSGINIGAQSSATLLSGGIDFATPDAGDKVAPPGTSFRLYDKPEDEWLGWSPAIELGEEGSISNLATYVPK